jgi:hypothetical protein
LSQRRKEPFDLMLVRYGIERRLYRLSRSSQAEKFLLKGAMLFAIWSDGTHRPTRDVDLLGSGPHDDETLKTIFTELCRLETEPDGRAAPHWDDDRQVSSGARHSPSTQASPIAHAIVASQAGRAGARQAPLAHTKPTPSSAQSASAMHGAQALMATGAASRGLAQKPAMQVVP